MALTQAFTLRNKWLNQIGNPAKLQIHSVWYQLWKMIDSYLDLTIIGFIAELEPNCPFNNPMIRRLARDGFAPLQALGIRRLWSVRRDDISINRIIQEMKGNISVFSRENYLAFSELPYDIPIVSTQDLFTHPPSPLPGSAFVSPDSSFMINQRTRQAHEQFDRLSKTEPPNRKPSDRIPKRFFDILLSHISGSGIDKVTEWSHQNIAHAGNQDHPTWKELNPTWNDIWSAQRTLSQVAQIISGLVLNGPASAQLVPTAQYNKFEFLEKVISRETLIKAQEKKVELEAERNSWLKGDLLKVIGWS